MNLSFWLVAGLTCAITLAPLLHPGLYRKLDFSAAPGLFVAAAAAIRVFQRLARSNADRRPALGRRKFLPGSRRRRHRPARPTRTTVAIIRIARAVEVIETRLPYNQYPAFWFQASGPDTLEFQGVMCAFLSHGISMLNFLRWIAPTTRAGSRDLDVGAEIEQTPPRFLWQRNRHRHRWTSSG